MGLFAKKKPKVVDWTEKLNRQQKQIEDIRSDSNSYPIPSSSTNETSITPFPFFAGSESNKNSSTQGNSYGNSDSTDKSSLEEKRKRLGKRLLDMTNKIEEMSNQMYKLQQRIEVLERRAQSSY